MAMVMAMMKMEALGAGRLGVEGRRWIALGDEEGPCAMHLRTKHSSTKHHQRRSRGGRW